MVPEYNLEYREVRKVKRVVITFNVYQINVSVLNYFLDILKISDDTLIDKWLIGLLNKRL